MARVLPAAASSARQAPRPDEAFRRRSLVGTALAAVMRRLAIPSDWIGCNALEAVSRTGRTRTVIQLVVHKGEDKLLPLVHTFQQQLESEMRRQDLDSANWVSAICWEFRGQRDPRFARMPDPAYWTP